MQKLLPLDKCNQYYVRSDGEFKIGLTTIPDRLGTKGVQLILNFPNASGNLSNYKTQYEIK